MAIMPEMALKRPMDEHFRETGHSADRCRGVIYVKPGSHLGRRFSGLPMASFRGSKQMQGY